MLKKLVAIAALCVTAACAETGTISELAPEGGGETLLIADAERAARVFEIAGNPAGKRCMDFVAGKLREVEKARAAAAGAAGPLTKFAIAHSAIEVVQNRDSGGFGDACGALRMQVRGNVTGIVGRVLAGGL